MGSIVIQANTTAQEAFITSSIGTETVKKILVNHRGANLVELTFQDAFTTSASVVATTGVAAVSAATTEDKLIISVAPGTQYETSDSFEGLRFLGTCQVESDVTDADCDISIIW